MFGQPSSTPFGSPQGFGATNTAPAFGSPQPAPFGQPQQQQQQQPSAFGGGSTFGTPAAPSTGGFGTSTNAFGSSAAPSTGGFGASGGFGSTGKFLRKRKRERCSICN